jgi:hypothetical protein
MASEPCARLQAPWNGKEIAMTTDHPVQVSVLRWAPPIVHGLVRDLRVRWALEEAGWPYREHVVSREDQASASYRELQPFGQVPAFRSDELTLFESGAIVHHIAERSPAFRKALEDHLANFAKHAPGASLGEPSGPA